MVLLGVVAVEIDDLGLGFITLNVDLVLGLYEDVVVVEDDGVVFVVDAVDMVLLVVDEDGAEIGLDLLVAVVGLVLVVLDDEGLVGVEEVVLVAAEDEAALEDGVDVLPVALFAVLVTLLLEVEDVLESLRSGFG